MVQLQWSGTPGVDDWKVSGERDAAFALSCERAGVSAQPVPVAINRDCANLGWCSTGCVRHGKNSVDLRYINPAEALGAAVRTGVKVSTVGQAGKAAGRRWRVQTDKGDVLADNVVLSGGAIGSPAVLLSSVQAGVLGGGLSSHVGRNLSRGGDMVIPVVLADDLGLDDMEMLPGKIIGSCSFQHLFEPPPGFGPDWPRFVMQPMMMLPMLSALMVADPDGITSDGGDQRLFGEGQKHLMRHWGDRLLHIGVMGMDAMDGQVTVAAGVPFVTLPHRGQDQGAVRRGHRRGPPHLRPRLGGPGPARVPRAAPRCAHHPPARLGADGRLGRRRGHRPPRPGLPPRRQPARRPLRGRRLADELTHRGEHVAHHRRRWPRSWPST